MLLELKLQLPARPITVPDRIFPGLIIIESRPRARLAANNRLAKTLFIFMEGGGAIAFIQGRAAKLDSLLLSASVSKTFIFFDVGARKLAGALGIIRLNDDGFSFVGPSLRHRSRGKKWARDIVCKRFDGGKDAFVCFCERQVFY